MEDIDGEWVDTEDDHDDEITFRANANPDEVVPNEQLDDTLPYVSPPRQQDECQEQQNAEGDNLVNDNFVYDEYQTFDPPDQFDNTFYTVNDYWNDNNDTEPLYDDDTITQVDDEFSEQEHRYVTHIQDGYTIEQSIQEGYESDIEAVPNLRAQEVITAYPDLELTHAIENHHNWAPTPVKVVGPEPELRKLFLHEQSQADMNDPHYSVKKEPPSLTSTPRKKTHFALGDETYSLQSPKVQLRSMAKLTNMFAEDLPNNEEKPPTMPHGRSPMVNTYNMHFTVSGAAGDYDLFTPNRRQQNNNNNNANRGRPGRGRVLRGVAPARGVPNRGAHGRAAPGRGAVSNRAAHGRVAPGRGVPARGGIPRGTPGHGNPPREQVPQAVPGRNPPTTKSRW